jgi:energy-coupling factor transporter ATP-binding protein EcfA2
MLTKLSVRNFKRFLNVDIELGSPVVFIGPNNSGKTTALQALALWDIGRRLWLQKRTGKKAPEKRPGVTINRRDLIAVPVPDANLLWRDLHVRDVKRLNGRQETTNVRIDVVVEGASNDKAWTCGFEFDYANEESFYCRPLRTSEGENPSRMLVPEEVRETRVAFLPPMSGLAANETRLDVGAINVRLGEGRTAEVLRNLCYLIHDNEESQARVPPLERAPGHWKQLSETINSLFRVRLDPPKYIAERGEIEMTYRDASGVRLDLSSSGRGLQQTLLLLAHLAVNPGSVLLLDEPDAHLEILRQRQIYQLLSDSAREQRSQIIAASHSEVVLDEAADRDVVVAFLGKPHRIDDRGSQLLKSLKEIGFEHYYQAEETGWVLYVEGSTDLAILAAFSTTLDHPARAHLERPFSHYVMNQPSKAWSHFYGLREAKPNLVGFALFDRLDHQLEQKQHLVQHVWKRREIENYLCSQRTLLAYADACVTELALGPLFDDDARERYRAAMRESIEDLVPRAAQRDPQHRWWHDTKVSDDFLDPLFESFFAKLHLPNLMRKTHYHVLARHVPADEIDPEVSDVLDGIIAAAEKAKPAAE